jgi:hypothetical protein
VLEYIQTTLRGFESRKEEANEAYTFSLDTLTRLNTVQASVYQYLQLDENGSAVLAEDRHWLTSLKSRLDVFLFEEHEANTLVRLLLDLVMGQEVHVYEVTIYGLDGRWQGEAVRADWLIEAGAALYYLHLGMRDVPQN